MFILLSIHKKLHEVALHLEPVISYLYAVSILKKLKIWTFYFQNQKFSVQVSSGTFFVATEITDLKLFLAGTNFCITEIGRGHYIFSDKTSFREKLNWFLTEG